MTSCLGRPGLDVLLFTALLHATARHNTNKYRSKSSPASKKSFLIFCFMVSIFRIVHDYSNIDLLGGYFLFYRRWMQVLWQFADRVYVLSNVK